MKFTSSRIISLALLIVTVTALIAVPVAAAQITVLSVTPNTIVNDVSNNIIVTGTGFDGSSIVVLDGATQLGTTLQDPQNLSAIVPAGLSAGGHAITVSNATGSTTLTVLAPTAMPTATFTPTATSTRTPLPFVRPQFVVRSSKPSGGIRTGGNLKLEVIVENAGTASSFSTQAVFSSTDLIPTKTGGVVAIGAVVPDDEIIISQTFFVSAQITGSSVLVTDLTITYYDDAGATYSDKFTLSIPVSAVPSSGGGSVAATATPTGVKSSQLVITNYSASVDPLQPGMQFALKMTVQNVGNADAKRITMIVGGGSSGGNDGGTPQPGGVSGGGGEFTNFAPVGASNVQSLGDLAASNTTQASQNLIVNVSTSPGAYPMKVTFSYLNDKNEVINDEQVITLLVYNLPSVDVSFYRPPDPFVVGQGGMLPIQVVNLGKRTAVLGNIKVTSGAGTIENGSSLVGSLDPGGYFTLDSFLSPEQSGTVKLNVVIEYVDDFNAPRKIEKTLEVEVMEGFVEEPVDPSVNGGGEFMPEEEETTMHKIFRFIKGLFGLDSAWPVWQPPGGGVIEETPSESKPLIAPAGKG